MAQGQFNQENQKISRLLEAFLKRSGQSNDLASNNEHLNEDALSAFVEGDLSRREAAPLLKHLVNCSLCRKITAQLVQLAMEFEEKPEIQLVNTSQSRLNKFFGSLTAPNFGFADDAVFAHQEPAKENQPENDAESSVDENRKSENFD